jgi:hypothetical protein
MVATNIVLALLAARVLFLACSYVAGRIARAIVGV